MGKNLEREEYPLTDDEQGKLTDLLSAYENAVAFDYGIHQYNEGFLRVEVLDWNEDEIYLDMVSATDWNSEEYHEELTIWREKLALWNGEIESLKSFGDLIEG